uniref:Major intrinsic protein domain containing protein n=1 Tax=Haemonchus contortus TaxID=6289 RepID=A0A7I4YTH9_HAECO
MAVPSNHRHYQTFKTQTQTTGSTSPSKQMPSESETYSLLTKCVAEFIAVLIFIFVGSTQAIVTNVDGVLHAAITHGVAIFVLVSCFAHISGGHVNPAVTIGLAAAGKIPPLDALLYVVSQLCGGTVGALFVRGVLSYEQYVSIQGGATLCAPETPWFQGLIAEVLTTMFLVQTVLTTAVDASTVLAPLAIGFTVLMDIMAVGAISGASMNPARSFGPNIVAMVFMHSKIASNFWTLHWIYYVGPIFGALLAAGLYRVFFTKGDRVV